MTEPSDRRGDVAPVRAFWEELGLPGLFDVHVHFLPPGIQKAVWAVFDAAGPKIGREWPIRYRSSYEDRVELLRAMGVRRFSTLPYAHKPGVAAHLNDWSRMFALEEIKFDLKPYYKVELQALTQGTAPSSQTAFASPPVPEQPPVNEPAPQPAPVGNGAPST